MSFLSAGTASTRAFWSRALHRTRAKLPDPGLPRNLIRRLPGTLFTIAGAEGPRPYSYKARPLVRCLPSDSIIEWTNEPDRRDPDVDRFTATTASSEAILPAAGAAPVAAGRSTIGAPHQALKR
jgi:hypothetical protein